MIKKLLPRLDIPACPGWTETMVFRWSALKRGLFGWHDPGLRAIYVYLPLWPFSKLIIAHERWHAWTGQRTDVQGYDLMSPRKGLIAWARICWGALRRRDWFTPDNRARLDRAMEERHG